MKKRNVLLLSLLLSVLMVTGIFAGCAQTKDTMASETSKTTETSQSKETATPTAEATEAPEVSLVFASPFEDRWITLALEKYTELNPNVTIEYQYMDHDSYQQKMTISVESDTLPDLFWWNGLYLQQTWASKPEVLTDMSAYITQETYDCVTEDGWNTFCRDEESGAIYAFPETIQVQGWLVNVEIFEKCGLEAPETTTELLAAIPTLKENGYIPMAFGTKAKPYRWGFDHLMNLWGYWELADDLFVNATLAVEDSDIVNVYEYVADLYEAGAFPEDNSTMTWKEECVALFQAEQAAVIMCPSDNCAGVLGIGTDNDISEKCIFIHAFTFDDSPYNQKKAVVNIANGTGVGSSVADDPDKLAVVADFVNWVYTDEEFMRELVEGYGAMIPTTMDTSSWDIPSYMAEAMYIATSGEYEGCLPSYNAYQKRWYYQNDFTGSYGTLMHVDFLCGLADGSITRDEILDRCKEGTALIAYNIANGALVDPNAK